MKSKKELLGKSRLYVIIDKKFCGHKSARGLTRSIIDRGAQIIQLRDQYSPRQDILRQALALRSLLSSTSVIFIINDYLDIAKIIDSDGIHLGQEDSSVAVARRLLGADKIIGVSCRNLRQAQQAQAEGADYVAIGPVFATPLKPEYKTVNPRVVSDIARGIRVPFFAIGGISAENIPRVLSLGANRIAVCRAVSAAARPKATCRRLRSLLYKSTEYRVQRTENR